MAGGMGGRRDRPSLAERAVQGHDGPASAQPPEVRHCWVLGPYGRLPALLLGWEQRVDGWHGRVVHPIEDVNGWVVVEEWLPADRLERDQPRSTSQGGG